jgi:hypothetical protein
MGLFDYKPHISKRDFKQIKIKLRKKGFSKREIDKVEQIFRGDIEESGPQIGIDRGELEKGINWMRRNKASHGIPERKINILEEELKRKIK